MNEQAANLMASYLGLVRALAWRIHQQLPRSVELDDLVGYGCVGLAEAARAYDPSRGHKFSTFAFHRIRGAILDGLSQMAWFRPEKFAANEYRREDDSAGDGDEPESPDLAEAALRANAHWYRQAAERLERSLLENAGNTGRHQSGESAAIERELNVRVRELVEALPAAAAELLKATYYEGLTLKDAAARMGHDKSWASRLHARALAKLHRSLRAEGLV